MPEDSLYLMRVLVNGKVDVEARELGTLRGIVIRTTLYDDEQHLLDAVEKKYNKDYTGKETEFQILHCSSEQRESYTVVQPVLYKRAIVEMGIDVHGKEPDKAFNYMSSLPQNEAYKEKLRTAQIFILAIRSFLSDDEKKRLSDTLTLQDLEEMGLGHIYEEIKQRAK